MVIFNNLKIKKISVHSGNIVVHILDNLLMIIYIYIKYIYCFINFDYFFYFLFVFNINSGTKVNLKYKSSYYTLGT